MTGEKIGPLSEEELKKRGAIGIASTHDALGEAITQKMAQVEDTPDEIGKILNPTLDEAITQKMAQQ